MEKKKQSDFADLMHTQIVAISKAGAYDAILPRLEQLDKQNKEFRRALDNVLKEVSEVSPSEMVNTPALLIERVGRICIDVLKANRPI